MKDSLFKMSVNKPLPEDLLEGRYDDDSEDKNEELDVCGDVSSDVSIRDVTKPPQIGFSIAQIMGFIQKTKTETAEAAATAAAASTDHTRQPEPQKSDDDESDSRTTEEDNDVASPHLWRPQPCRQESYL